MKWTVGAALHLYHEIAPGSANTATYLSPELRLLHEVEQLIVGDLNVIALVVLARGEHVLDTSTPERVHEERISVLVWRN